MDLKELIPGTVVVDLRGKLCIVIGIDLNRPKNPVRYMTGNLTKYIGSPDFFRTAVGTVDLAKLEAATAPRPTTTFGQGTASSVDESADMTPLFGPLAGLKVGDKVTVTGYGAVKPAIYSGYNPRATRLPVKVLINGKKYKVAAENIVRAI